MQDEEEVNIQEEDNSEQPVVDETEEAVIETPSTTKKLENSKSSPHFKMQRSQPQVKQYEKLNLLTTIDTSQMEYKLPKTHKKKRRTKQKERGFNLDCCNVGEDKLPSYNARSDKYLSHFFPQKKAKTIKMRTYKDINRRNKASSLVSRKEPDDKTGEVDDEKEDEKVIDETTNIEQQKEKPEEHAEEKPEITETLPEIPQKHKKKTQSTSYSKKLELKLMYRKYDALDTRKKKQESPRRLLPLQKKEGFGPESFSMNQGQAMSLYTAPGFTLPQHRFRKPSSIKKLKPLSKKQLKKVFSKYNNMSDRYHSPNAAFHTQPSRKNKLKKRTSADNEPHHKRNSNKQMQGEEKGQEGGEAEIHGEADIVMDNNENGNANGSGNGDGNREVKESDGMKESYMNEKQKVNDDDANFNNP